LEHGIECTTMAVTVPFNRWWTAARNLNPGALPSTTNDCPCLNRSSDLSNQPDGSRPRADLSGSPSSLAASSWAKSSRRQRVRSSIHLSNRPRSICHLGRR